MLLSAIAAVLLAAVAKRRIGAARPKYRARTNTAQDAHPEAHVPPDVKRVIHSLGGSNARILPQCEDGTYLSGIYDRGDDNYARALATAIADENIVVMDCILAHGGSFEGCPDCRGQTPLLAACFAGSTKIAKHLLARGADISAKTTMDGIPDRPTCLHIAAYYNYQTLADVLLAHGAPVDEPMDDGASPLYVACMQGHSEVAGRLLDAGADVTTTTQKILWTRVEIKHRAGCTHRNIIN